MFTIFDLGRYALTVHSLRMLANAGARSVMIYPACATAAAAKQSLSGCGPADPLSTTQKQSIAPFLHAGDLTPTLGVSAGGSSLTVTASQSAFSMIMPIWGTSLNAPSATASIPF